MPTGSVEASKTHCPMGHAYDEANTYWQTKKDGRRGRCCRACATVRMQRKRENPEFLNRQAKATAAWRARNPELNRQQYNDNRRRKKEWLDSQKLACPCGEARIPCLDFHHKNPAEKSVNLSMAVAHWSIKRLEVEMAKCITICANCHRMLHWEERQSKREKV